MRPRPHPRRWCPDILDPENQYSYSWNDLGADPRHGISVMDDREALAEYIAQTGIQWDETWELLEVEGFAVVHDADAVAWV